MPKHKPKNQGCQKIGFLFCFEFKAFWYKSDFLCQICHSIGNLTVYFFILRCYNKLAGLPKITKTLFSFFLFYIAKNCCILQPFGSNKIKYYRKILKILLKSKVSKKSGLPDFQVLCCFEFYVFLYKSDFLCQICHSIGNLTGHFCILR